MKITPIHYAALAATLNKLHPSITPAVLAQIIGEEGMAEYGFLGALTDDDAKIISVPPLRRLALNAIRALTESLSVCTAGHGLALERVPNTADWRQVPNCTECGALLEAPQRDARVYDWIAGVDVDPDTTHHQGAGYRVPLAIPALETYLGAQLDIRIAHAAGLEGLDVPQMLTALLHQKAGRDVRALLGVLSSLPPAWTVADGLRVTAREWKARPKGGDVVAPPTAALDLNGIITLAIESGLADPGRRDLLLAWLPPRVTSQLPRMSRPTDQIRSDVGQLAQWNNAEGVPQLTIWLDNAARLTDYLPGVAARFSAYRRSLAPGQR